MAVNIYDIAKKSGLSVVTVSRVLNNYPSVRESNRIKVAQAITELDYKPNAAARTLASGKAGMVALVIPNMQDHFMSGVMSSAEKSLRKNGLFMAVTSASDSSDFLKSSCASLFMEGRVDGILILAPVRDGGAILELKKRNIPFVLLDQHQMNNQVPCVTVDNFYGGYQATMSLIKGGARKIAHISGAKIYESSSERTRGYLKALKDSGMKADDGMLVEGDFTVACGYNAAVGWIKCGILPDAVFAANDNTAYGILDAAREYGIAVPQKLAIIGYDDHPFDSMLHPQMSTVKQPSEKIGEYGVKLLLDIIKNKPRKTSRVILKPEIILRGTTLQ